MAAMAGEHSLLVITGLQSESKRKSELSIVSLRFLSWFHEIFYSVSQNASQVSILE